jgi:hypothetical protein
VDIAHQFQKIGFFFTYDRSVPILKKMSSPVMPPVEIQSISREKTSHEVGDPLGTAEKQEMNMLGINTHAGIRVLVEITS